MNLLLSTLLVSAFAVEPHIAPGVQLHYQGTVAKVDRDAGNVAEKSFDLALLVVRADDDGAAAYTWTLDERGAGGFGWADRAGRWSQNAAGAPLGVAGPALLYDFGTGRHVVPLEPPRFALPDGAEAGLKWEADELEYEIVRSTTAEDRPAWEIDVRNQFGPRRRLWVDRDSEVVLRYDERVFMNQGTEYRLAARLADVEQLEADVAKSQAAAAVAIVALRNKLKLPVRKHEHTLTPAQLATFAEALPAAKQAASSGQVAQIVAEAERELKRQQGRTSALEALVAKQTDREVATFSAAGAGDAKLSDADLRGKVTVLHFWEYRDAPLVEPYGQVGYLEFLYNKRKDDGVQVVGIAVDGRFQQPGTAGAAASGVRKLKNFMNLTYPIVYDGGSLVAQFGDPRPTGAVLPLFVVVGRDGRVKHYKAGLYDVDREAGLKHLDAIVAELLEE